MKARWLLEATGASILFLLPYLVPLIVPWSLVLYRHRLPITNISRGLLLDISSAIFLGCALIAVLSRLSPLPRRVAGACLASLIVWHSAGTVLAFLELWQSTSPTGNRLPKLTHGASILWKSWTHPIAIGILLLLVALAWLRPTAYRPVIVATRLGLAGFAFNAVWLAPRLFTLAFVPYAFAQSAHGLAQQHGNSEQRIVWVLFDELSDDLVFDHRPEGLILPNFEQLHSRSLSFGNIQPVGFYTDRIVPSLLAGESIDEVKGAPDGWLEYKDSNLHRWHNYDPHKTLFSLAQDHGWSPGVSGWYNPYCRIFGSVLTSCSWESDSFLDTLQEPEGASEDKSPLENALVVPRFFAAKLSGQAMDTRPGERNRHIQEYQRLMQQGSKLIHSDQVRFVLLHLPVPHPPGYYNRDTHELSESGNYIDNLVLADDTLGSLLKEIDGTPWASRTTLIISSDHSWRIPTWRGAPGWTNEEEKTSHGRFDPRPVFLVHFPGEISGGEVRAPLPELMEHDIIAGMLKGEINTPEDLEAFVQRFTQQKAHSGLSAPPPLQ
jgi:hypothetical protein